MRIKKRDDGGSVLRATRVMSFKPDTLDKEARTVELVFTTGSRGKRYSWFSDDFYEELEVSKKAIRLGRLKNGAPLLDMHNARSLDSVLGVVEDAWVDGEEGLVRVRFDDTVIAERRMKSIENGIIKNVSVGYDVHEFRELEEKAEDGLSIFRAVDWEPAEVSLVSIGFDDNAMVRCDSKDKTNPCKLTRRDMGVDDMAEKKKDEKIITEPTNSVDVEAIKREALAAERKRVSRITKVGQIYKFEERAQELITEGKTFEEAQDVIVDLAAERSKETAASTKVSVGEMDKSKKMRAFEDAILFKVNRSRYAKQGEGNEYRGGSFAQMVRHMTGAEGDFTSDRKLVKRAMSNSTSDFPILLSNVAGKVLRDEFSYVGNNYENLIKRTEAKDFKDIERDRLGDFANLLEVKEGEEYTYSTIAENKEVYRVSKFGRLFRITFEALVNDDLNAFSRIGQKIAVAALRKERDLVWDLYTANPLMSDGFAWFSTQHGNLAGTPAALSEASLAAAEVAFMAQTGEAGDFLAIPAQFLIVAPINKVTANKLVANTTPASTSDVNPFAGQYQVIVEPKLSVLNSGKSWFLSASPTLIDTAELAYLEDDGGLVIDEIPELKNDTIEWKARLVAGSAPIEYRGVYKDAGA